MERYKETIDLIETLYEEVKEKLCEKVRNYVVEYISVAEYDLATETIVRFVSEKNVNLSESAKKAVTKLDELMGTEHAKMLLERR